MILSVIIPVMNEEKNISILAMSLKNILSVVAEYEIIFIDDGSTDFTVKEIEEAIKWNYRIKLIKFKKNFGKSAALTAGTKLATGDIIITMDGDLQDDPKEIPKFITKLIEGNEVVVGWKYPRLDPWHKLLFSKVFNWMTSKLVGLTLHDYNCGFKAYMAESIKSINLYGDLHRYIPALLFWQGYKVTELKVTHHPRINGKSKYGWSRIYKGFFDLLAIKFLQTFKKKPLLFFGGSGLLLTFLGGFVSLYLIWIYFTAGGLFSRPLIFLAMLLIILGFQFISIGLIGVLVIDATIKSNESYVIEKVVN